MDTDPRDLPPKRQEDPYTYTSYTPGQPERTPDAAPADAGEGDGANGASPGAPPPHLVPATANGAAPVWEWSGGSASPPPSAPPPASGWYTVVGPTPARPADYERPAAGNATGGGWRRTPVGRWLSRVWPLVLLALSKAKWLLVLFKFKVFTTFFSLLLSLGVYAMAFGLPFAAGFIALLFIHEMGHALVMRQQGIKTTPVLFIPFMGAVIGMKEMPKNVFAEAKMALGGPILGSLGAVGCLGLWQLTGHPIFVALAMMGFWLNLFNLIPVSPLDGGRAMAAISPYGWFVGLALLALLFLRVHSIFLGVILIVGAMEVFKRWQTRNSDRAYYEATFGQRATITGVYFGLAGLLAFGVFYLQGHLLAGQPLI